MADSKMANKFMEDKPEEEREKWLVGIFAPSLFFTVFSGGMLLSARQALAIRHFKDSADMTQFLQLLSSAGALFEFLVNPVIGKLSDTYGRKPILPTGNLACVLVRFLQLLRPEKKWPIVIEQVISIPLVTGFFTTYRAAMGDLLSGAAYARCNARISMAAGMAIITGPLVAKLVMARTDPKWCYALSVVMASSSAMNLVLRYKETLPLEDRKPLILADMQPLSFLKMFKKSAVLARLMSVVGIQSTTEGRNIDNIFIVYMRSDLGWDWNQVNNFVAAYGTSLIFSGLAVKSMLAKLGLLNFTSFSNFCNITFFMALMRLPPWSFMSDVVSMYLGLVFAAPGGRKRDACESLIMDIGSKHGFGKGFISGSMNNLRSVINVVGPVIFGAIYSYGAKRKRPTLPFFVGCGTIVLAELLLRTLTKEELGLDEHGQLRKAAAPKEEEEKKEQ